MFGTLLCLALATSPSFLGPQDPQEAILAASHPIPDGGGEPFLVLDWPGYGRWQRLQPSWVDGSSPWDPLASQHWLKSIALSYGVEEACGDSLKSISGSDPVTVGIKILRDGEEVLVGKETALPGLPLLFSDVFRRQVVMDLDCQIASGASILEPILGSQAGGSALGLQILPVAGLGWQVEVAAMETRPEPGAEVQFGNDSIRGKAELNSRLLECGAFHLCRPGQPVVVEINPGGSGGVQILLQLDGQLPPAGVALEERSVWLQAPTWVGSDGFRAWEEAWSQRLDIEVSGQGDLLLHGDGREEALASALGQIRSASQPVSLQLTAQAVKDGVEEEPFLIRMPLSLGREFRFAQGLWSDALTNWTVEVAQGVRQPDPWFTSIFSGGQGTLQVVEVDGHLHVDADLRFTHAEVGRRRPMVLAPPIAGASGPQGDISPQPAVHVQLQNPIEGEVLIQGRYPVDEQGLVQIWRSANRLYGESAMLRLTIQLQR